MVGGIKYIPILKNFVVRRERTIIFVIGRLGVLKFFDGRDLAGALEDTRSMEQLIELSCREVVGRLNQKDCFNLEGQLVI